jgi:hypothetical protein
MKLIPDSLIEKGRIEPRIEVHLHYSRFTHPREKKKKGVYLFHSGCKEEFQGAPAGYVKGQFERHVCCEA